MIKRLADNIAGYLQQELSYEQKNGEILSYGLEIALGTLAKVLSILMISYIMGTFESTIIALISFILFRRIIGGAHCDSFRQCYTTSIAFILLLGLLGKFIILPRPMLNILIILSLIINLFINYHWVPSLSVKKVILGEDKSQRIKVETALMLILWVAAVIVANNLFAANHIFSCILGIDSAFFFATPFGKSVVM
jgi:accessory gene regulator B